MILRRIRRWLGLDNLEKKYLLLNKRVEKWEGLVEVGVDVHMKDNSWAVICIGGKAEYVHFYTIGQHGEPQDLRYLLDILRQMKHSRIIIDANPAIRQEIQRFIY